MDDLNPHDSSPCPQIVQAELFPPQGGGVFAHGYCLLRMVARSTFSLELQLVLTLLTMAIGSLALAATLFAGEGALSLLWQDLDLLMGNRVAVHSDLGPDKGLLKRRPTADLTTEDFAYVKARLAPAAGWPGARYVAPNYFGRAYIEFHDKSRYMSVDGIADELLSEPAYRPLQGRDFSAGALNALVWECLITQSAAKFLNIRIEKDSAIRVGSQRFQVVGIVPDPPEADPPFKPRIIMPYTASHHLWGRPGVLDSIVVAWNGPENMDPTVRALCAALDECRLPGAYRLSSSQFAIQKRRGIVSNFMVVGSAQSLFCILVATIGIINVMLANVVRRSREFAIRVAMGAHHRDIIVMVLLESFLLGLVGAVIGIVAAALVASPLCTLISSHIQEASQLRPYIGVRGILIPLIVCSLSGLAAGVIPALRVRKLDILEVLRAE